MKQYSSEQIRRAFWTTFHKNGEMFFPYVEDETENNDVTESYWREFFYLLNRESSIDEKTELINKQE